ARARRRGGPADAAGAAPRLPRRGAPSRQSRPGLRPRRHGYDDRRQSAVRWRGCGIRRWCGMSLVDLLLEPFAFDFMQSKAAATTMLSTRVLRHIIGLCLPFL